MKKTKKGEKIRYDNATRKWFDTHQGSETTVCRCDTCGLYYKASLQHICERSK